jgi:hypothetical protein
LARVTRGWAAGQFDAFAQKKLQKCKKIALQKSHDICNAILKFPQTELSAVPSSEASVRFS